MNSQIELDNIVEAINRANSIGIFTHVSPDGDAVGSSLALYLGLKSLNKEVEVIVDEFSLVFNFLTGVNDIKREGRIDGYDLAIALDCASFARLFDVNNSFNNSIVSVCVDHHVSNTFFANYNYIEGNSPAVCMTLVRVFKKLGVSLTKEIGECLMAGIITDSGGFRYSDVNDETFEFAAQMLDLGVNISDIYYRTFDFKTKAQFQLSTIAVSRLNFYKNEQIALTYLKREDFVKTKAKIGDHEGIVNIARNIEGVKVSVFLKEEELDVYNVSLRSNSDIDVSLVAALFGGGGHTKAAGFVINGKIDDIIKKIVKEISKKL